MKKDYNKTGKDDFDGKENKPTGKGKSKGKFNKSKSKSRDRKDYHNEKDDKGNSSAGYLNDASWYIKDEQIRQQASNFPFNTFLGLPDSFEVESNRTVDLPIPTVFSIRVNPSVGKTNIYAQAPGQYTSAAAINACARVWYNKISAQTGRTANYSPDDIAIILGAMSELTSTVAQAFRIYGLAFNYSMRNRSIPKSLLAATGVDPDSILSNMAEFRMRLNTLLIQANALPIPADVKLFEKNWNLFTKAFIDETSAMAQMFMFTEFSTWVLVERTGSTGSILDTVLLDGSGQGSTANEKYTFTGDQLLDVIERQISALQLATTYNQVYADIMQIIQKGGGKFYQFGYLPELFGVLPEFSEEAITQMHNLTVMGMPLSTVPTGAPSYVTPANNVVADVTQAAVHYNPAFPHKMCYSFEPLLDMPFTDNPSTDDKINATRFMMARNKLWNSTDETQIWDDYTISDKYVVAVLALDNSGADLSNAGLEIYRPTVGTTYMDAGRMHKLMTCRHYPTVYLYDYTTSEFVTYIQELNFFTHLPFKFLERLNDLCMYGLVECVF